MHLLTQGFLVKSMAFCVENEVVKASLRALRCEIQNDLLRRDTNAEQKRFNVD